MLVMEILYTSQFARQYKKLAKEIKLLAENKEKIFRENPFHSALDTHKLHGRLREFWSFSIGHRYRVIFEFGDKDVIYFHAVGDHEIYQ